MNEKIYFFIIFVLFQEEEVVVERGKVLFIIMIILLIIFSQNFPRGSRVWERFAVEAIRKVIAVGVSKVFQIIFSEKDRDKKLLEKLWKL